MRGLVCRRPSGTTCSTECTRRRASGTRRWRCVCLPALSLCSCPRFCRHRLAFLRLSPVNVLPSSLSHFTFSRQVASKKDRINLRGTFHAWGRHLEAEGDIEGAIHAYEKAEPPPPPPPY